MKSRGLSPAVLWLTGAEGSAPGAVKPSGAFCLAKLEHTKELEQLSSQGPVIVPWGWQGRLTLFVNSSSDLTGLS